ncbi:hypothetical protein [Vibrio mediterranei]|uniref:Uncharacterized protein n=1 Tax=Vibrio mediterranei TaxID=689 RepID=A0A3G4V8I3_9VIBR|nr:hypothetical protein [Vibrio mediterranei]AYV21103.1 hypothetical protein ECB94_07260 [Vibrio mediterranei]
MDMPTPCQNCGELHDLNDLRESREKQFMVCDDCFQQLEEEFNEGKAACDTCGNLFDEVLMHPVDNGELPDELLCDECFDDLCDEEEE